MADNRTMAQLLEAPTEGYEDAIVIPEITANNFEIKHGLLNLVQNKQFFGNDKEDPHAHIRYFNKITSTMKIPNVPNTSVKLMLFPFSLEGAARIWLEKEPPRSIETIENIGMIFVEETCKTKVKTPAIPEWQNLTDMISQNFVNTNKASTSVSGTLPGTLVTNQSLRSKQEKLSEMAKKIETKLARQRVILNKLPKKNWRPRQIPFIPCEFSAVNMQCLGRILVQASILCRISCGKDLFFRVLPQTCLTLELEDRSIHNTNRIDKDVRVLVGKFQFPADFVVVEFEPDPRVPLILGRCFLKTSRALIDVHEGEITLRVGKEAINFQS
ncbi:reverse transcriptase domain-containing protein [Tanacetum coccineum]